MTTDTLRFPAPATLEYRKDEHALHPFQRIVLICAAIGAIAAACRSAIPMIIEFASTGLPLRYTTMWLAHELAQVAAGLIGLSVIIALLASRASRRMARWTICVILIALLTMQVTFQLQELSLYLLRVSPSLLVGESSQLSYELSQWMILIVACIVLSPRERTQAVSTVRTTLIAAVTSMLMLAFADGYVAWVLQPVPGQVYTNQSVYLYELYVCGGCAVAAALLVIAWQWRNLNRRLLCCLAIAFLVTPRSLALMEFGGGWPLRYALTLLTWQLALASPLIALVWMSHLTRRQIGTRAAKSDTSF
jgi:hypothetical protein